MPRNVCVRLFPFDQTLPWPRLSQRTLKTAINSTAHNAGPRDKPLSPEEVLFVHRFTQPTPPTQTTHTRAGKSVNDFLSSSFNFARTVSGYGGSDRWWEVSLDNTASGLIHA